MPKPGGCHSSGITLGDVDLALREAGRARATSPNWWNSALALNGRAGSHAILLGGAASEVDISGAASQEFNTSGCRILARNSRTGIAYCKSAVHGEGDLMRAH